MGGNQSFDWQGFRFATQIVVFLLCVGATVHFGWLYAQTHTTPVHPRATTVVAVQEVRPEPVANIVLSSTTPERVINTLTIADIIPPQGKFIAADLVAMKLYLYQDGTTTAEFSILTKGRPATPWETPSGFYTIASKERTHFSSIGHVYMPYSMQFYGNYFIHGWTYYPDGTPVSASFSGGCIKLRTQDAQKVFAFADVGTNVFVYDAKQGSSTAPLVLDALPTPTISAASYLVADIETGDVYAEQGAQMQKPITSVTTLMTALVANEIISLDKKVTVPEGLLLNSANATSTKQKTFLVDDLFYPLLMQSNSGVAEALASYYGTHGFIGWMNTTAHALDMASTTYVDPSGVSSENVSTTDDLYRLAAYLTNKKSFVLKITDTDAKTITAFDGSKYQVQNVNSTSSTSQVFVPEASTTAAMAQVSVVSVPTGNETRPIAVIILDSAAAATDTKQLVQWITAAAKQESSQAACVSCSQHPPYRKIPL